MLLFAPESNGLCRAAKKLHVDFAPRPWLACGMDEDAADLIIQLCTRAGMLMEDASVLALTLGSVEPSLRGQVLGQLVEASERISSLLQEAMALQP